MVSRSWLYWRAAGENYKACHASLFLFLLKENYKANIYLSKKYKYMESVTSSGVFVTLPIINILYKRKKKLTNLSIL